jgi:hypothetical protein
MTHVTLMSLEKRVDWRNRFGRDARAMFRNGLNTHDIAQVLGVPEHEIIAKRLHLAPLAPSFQVRPHDMPPPRGGAA